MTTTEPRARRRRVPAEHRVLGLDKRSFPPAIFVVVVFLVLTVLVPRVNGAIDWDDPVEPGEQLALTDDVVITPVVGWEVESGFRAGEARERSGPVVVSGDGVTVQVNADSFDGTPAELLEQVEKVTSRTSDPSFRADGDAGSVTTVSGVTGVVQPYSSLLGDGVVAAFVIDGTGIEVTAFGPPAQMSAAADRVADMIASIQTVPGSDA